LPTVAEYMKKDRIVSCSPDTTLREASKLMSEHGIGSLLVLGDGQRLEGIFTERDLVKAIAEQADPDKATVSEHMTRHVITVAPYESVVKASQKMLEHGIRHMPVVDSTGRVLGLLSIRDALRAMIGSHEFP